MADEGTTPQAGRAGTLARTLEEMTALMATLRRQQLEQEAYATVTRLALGALIRAAGPEARAAVIARLGEGPEALLGPGTPAASPLGRAVLEEAQRMAAALSTS